jgi:hypothetical protein
MSILKSEINLKGTKPRYYRSTKNFYCHFVDGFELVFSYQTLIAVIQQQGIYIGSILIKI